MKTATITLRTTENVPVPAGVTLPELVGFRLTLTRVASGNSLTLPVEQKLTWQFAEMAEGEAYQLKIEHVDAAGAPYGDPVLLDLVPPGAATYTRLDGADVAWS